MTELTTCLMFVGDQHGRAEEAIELYISLFAESGVIEIDRYGPDEEEAEGTVRPLQAYPFSPKFAWVEDRFGVTWQLNLAAAP